MIVMNPDDVAWFVDLQDLLGICLIHVSVIGPRLLLGSTIVRGVLPIVKECVKLMFGVSSPPALIF
jgi:hypothetical protein